MYKRYYDGYGKVTPRADHGEIIVPEKLPVASVEEEVKPQITTAQPDEIAISGMDGRKSLLNLPCELDDIILIGILLFLLFDKDKDENDNDIFMLLIIGFVLFSDIL